MSRPRNTEPQANGALARALSRRNPDWNDRTVHAERTNVIQQAVPGTGVGKRPDILIASPHRQPVILETEFAPAHTVDQDATARLGTSLHTTGEGPLAQISIDLHQEAGEQTERMAVAICVSAFVFHVAIEGQQHIPPVPLAGSIDKGTFLSKWKAILEINYWPIFSIARDLVEELPIKAVAPVMNCIAESISGLAQLGATTYHDLTGRMFQTLITDRKFLATFYTLPESACLLAELAVDRLDVDWSDRAAIEGLRIADFACGTGALLSAAQRAVYRRYRRAGGNDKVLHRPLMEHVLTGLDVIPAATHLTCSMLSSAHPSLAYGESQIHTMPYGIGGHRGGGVGDLRSVAQD